MRTEQTEILERVKEIGQRMRRMETKAHHMCNELGVKSVVGDYHKCEVRRGSSGIGLEVIVPAVDITLSTIKAAIKAADFDPLDSNGVDIILNRTGYSNELYATIYFE